MEAASVEELDAEIRKREEDIRKRGEEIRQLKELKKNIVQRKSPQSKNEPDIASTSTQGTVSDAAAPSNPDLPQQFKTYKKLPGTIDQGREYEQAMCAYYALKLTISQGVERFEMTTNNVEDGKFDDLGVTITYKDGSVQRVLMQLKHNKNKTVHISDLRSAKGDFSIKKYSDSISQMSGNVETTFFLFTNSATSIKGNVQINEDVSVERCTQWQFKDVLASTNEEDVIFEFKSKEFQQKFFFLTRQMDVKKAADAVNTSLRDLLRCDIHGSFFNYIKTWWAGKFVLTKHDVIAKITELALSPYVKPLTEDNCNRKTDSLKQTIMSFPLTLVEGSDEDIVRNIWNGEHSWTEEQFSKAREKYGVKERSTILWHLGKLPLVVRVDLSNEEIIRRVMNLLREDIGDKKIVLSGNVTKNDFESWDTLQSLWDVMKNCEATNHCSHILRNFHVSLQGRGSITLGDLVRADEDAAKSIGTKELLQMSQQEYLHVGSKKEELPALHIPRTVSTHFFKTKDVLKGVQSSRDREVIILNCDEKFAKKLSEDSAIHTMELSEYITNEATNEEPENIILWSARSKCTPLQFEAVCRIPQNRNVYLLQHFADDRCILTLRRGRGLEFKTAHETQAVKESEIFKYYNNSLHVLCAPPGMGKSTLMRALFNTCPSHSLAASVNLINHNPFLAERPDFETTFERFLRTDEAEDDLCNRLTQRLWQKRKLYMFLDGLDEINSQHVQHVLNFVKHLSSRGAIVWVSSRENLRQVICETLNVVPIDIKELNKEERENYINDKLEQSYRQEEIQRIKMVMFKSTDLSRSQNLLGIPLQLHIITEMFLRDTEVYKDLETKSLFVLTHMYRIFFEGKIKFAYSKLLDMNQEQQLGHLSGVLQDYELPALKVCLDKSDYQKMSLDGDEGRGFVQALKAEGDKYGVIKKINDNDEAIFNHQTYAEYFACVWLKKNRSKIRLLRDVIFTRRYEHLRLIFDVMLAENNPLHLAVIYKDLGQIEEHLDKVGRKDEGGRSAFHLAFSYGQKRRFIGKRESACCVKMIDRGVREDDVLEAKDLLFGFNCVDYALQSECLYAIERSVGKHLVTFDKLKGQFVTYGDSLDLIKLGYPSLLSEFIKEEKFYHLTDDEIFALLSCAVMGVPDDACTLPREGNMKVLQLLIDNFRMWPNPIYRSFLVACRGKYLDMLQIFADNHVECKNGNTLLHFLVEDCAERYHDEIVDAITRFNVDINARNDEGVTALHIAAASADQKIIDALMKNGADLNIVDKKGRSALHHTAEKGRLPVEKGLAQDRNIATPQLVSVRGKIANVEMLLTHGADPNLEDKHKNNAVHHILNSDSPSEDMIELLIRTGFSLDAPNQEGTTALHLAAKKGMFEIADMLLTHGARPNLEDNDKNNALHHVLNSPSPSKDMIELLIKTGMRVDAPNREGTTALHLTAKKGMMEAARMLLEHGARPNLEDKDKNNALHHALTSGSPSKDMVELLIETGMSVNAANQEGMTALHLAAKNSEFEIAEMLLKHGARPNLGDKDNNNALHYVLHPRFPFKFLIDLLIKTGASVNAPNQEGTTALHLAVKKGAFEIVETLLKHGARPDLEDKDKNNALHYVLHSPFPSRDITELLIKTGVGVNAPNQEGMTALHLAAKRGAFEIVEMLLKHGAGPNPEDTDDSNALSVNAQDQKGKSALHVAAKRGALGIVELLLTHGARLNMLDDAGNNALHYASNARLDADATIELLIGRGLDVDAKNADGLTPVDCAYADGNFKTLETLRKWGAKLDVRPRFDERRSLLHLICQTPTSTASSVVRRLLEQGVDPNVVDDHDKNALHYFLLHTYDKDLIHAMMDHGLNLNTRYQGGRTLLHVACLQCDAHTLRKLVEKGIDVNMSDDAAQSPLHLVLESLEQTEIRLRKGNILRYEHTHELNELQFGCELCYSRFENSLWGKVYETNFLERHARQKLLEFVGNHQIVSIFLRHVYFGDSSHAKSVTVRFKMFAMIAYLIENGSKIDVEGFKEADYAFQWQQRYPEIIALLRYHFPRELQARM